VTVFPGYEPPPAEPEPPKDVRLYTRAEHMIGEEYALLRIAEDQRTPEQSERLRVIGRELDRVTHALRQRAEALGRS
jgi:hypothetical protein